MQFSKRTDADGKGAGVFLKLKDSESVKGTFRGEVVEYYAIWDGKRYEPCDEHDAGAKFRFRINFVTRENGALVAKIFEQGRKVQAQLSDLHSEYNLEETIVNIKRTGSGPSDTAYTIMPAKENKVAPDMEAQLKAVALNDLTPKASKTDKSEPFFE